MGEIAISAQALGKRYQIGTAKAASAREAFADLGQLPRRLLSRNGGRRSTEFWALRDVSFDILEGDVMGVIGRNGAGKSTLLKILSRVTEPTTGRATLHGRVGSMLEVGTGFHPELTGRDNIFLNGSVLGMRAGEIKQKFDEIVAFSGIERFLDTPVKRYSSGMYVRLAFAVAAHLEPEILIVDEVLAVGDLAFQRKCLGKMHDVAATGRTVLFVSHNIGAIRQLCTKCIWLQGGDIRALGSCEEVTGSYLAGEEVAHGSNAVTFELDDSKAFQLTGARLLDRRGKVTNTFDCDHPIHIELTCLAREHTAGVYGFLQVRASDGTAVLTSDSRDSGDNNLDDLRAGAHRLVVSIPSRSLAAGKYGVYLSFASPSATERFILDDPGVIVTFSLHDNTTLRGDARPGYFSTILPWTPAEGRPSGTSRNTPLL